MGLDAGLLSSISKFSHSIKLTSNHRLPQGMKTKFSTLIKFILELKEAVNLKSRVH